MTTEQLAIMPFYQDWKFWSAVIAFCALVLSQLPPVHVMLRRRKLETEVFGDLYVGHRVGNTLAQLHLVLRNTGGRDIRVRGFQLTFERGKDESFTLPGRLYFLKVHDPNSVVWTPFVLKADEQWSHTVDFLNYYTRTEERQFRQAQSALRSNILARRQVELPNADGDVAGDAEFVEPFLDMFAARFKWVAGEYQVTLTVQTEPEGAAVPATFRFTLFESDQAELTSQVDGVKYGYGVFARVPDNNWLGVQLHK